MLDLSHWIGVFWITVWSSKFKEVTVGIGESFPAESNTVFHVKEYRKGPFYCYVTRPTITFLNKGR